MSAIIAGMLRWIYMVRMYRYVFCHQASCEDQIVGRLLCIVVYIGRVSQGVVAF